MSLQNKKILLLSTEDSMGGAYELMYRMASALNDEFSTVCLAVKQNRHTDLYVKKIPIHTSKKVNLSSRIIRVIKRFFGLKMPELASVANKSHLFYYLEEETQQFLTAENLLQSIGFTPEYVLIGLTTGFINTSEILRLYQLTKAKMIYVMLDMWPLTGGCHAILDCKGYTETCKICPAVCDTKHSETPHKQFLIRQSAYKQMRPIILGGSALIKRVWENSSLNTVTTLLPINSCIPTDIFNDRCRKIAKQIWNIPKEKFVIFAGSDNAKDPRKGRKYLVEALCQLYQDKRIDSKNILVILAGNHNHADENTKRIPFETKYIDYIRDMRLLSLLYQAADLYIMSSIEEGGPMMVPEAMLCGTMVVGFATGFLENDDLLVSETNGWRIPIKDSSAMALAIAKSILLSASERESYVQSAREKALETMSDQAFIRKFNTWINR